MLIAIPSRDRWKNARDLYTVRYTSPKVMERALWFVPEDQVDNYVVGLAGSVDAENIVACGADGIAKTRKFIGEFAKSYNYDKFIMLDDDIRFYVRADTDRPNLVNAHNDDVDNCMNAVELALDTYAHVSVSAREGNNRAGAGRPNELYVENTRTLRALAYRTEDFLGVEHGRVRVMEDFDVNLQLLGQGKKNCCLYWWAQGQRQTGSPGGCSAYRSHEVQEESARRLAELHPGAVTLRQKENKTGGEFGRRTEVTIQWKRKFAEATR